MPAVAPYNESIFENIKHINEYGEEFWYARELQNVLEYGVNMCKTFSKPL